ncbi:MAG: hypothetical protein V4553_06840 [Bacteroidota bacterium]
MQLTHGKLTLRSNPKNFAAVTLFDLPGFVQTVAHPMPGPNVNGTVTLDTVPTVINFKKNDIVDYSDSNNNNNASFTIKDVLGPVKFNVTSR